MGLVGVVLLKAVIIYALVAGHVSVDLQPPQDPAPVEVEVVVEP